MDFELFQEIIDQAAAGGAYSIKLNHLGEPLLHPRVVDMVKYAKGRDLEVMMNTNATLLSRELAEDLLVAGLDDIFFSIDSPYPEEYEAIRRGACFDQVIDKVRSFVEIKEKLGKNHVQTRASMVLRPIDSNDPGRREDFIQLMMALGVAEVGFGLLTDMTVDYRQAYGHVANFVCRDPYHRLFVFWDGAIGPCCGEWERGYLVGHMAENRLADVWHNQRYQALRQAHEQGHYDRIPICRACSVPFLSQIQVQP